VVRVPGSAICGKNLHLYLGSMPGMQVRPGGLTTASNAAS
jgi:hypothetical protein